MVGKVTGEGRVEEGLIDEQEAEAARVIVIY